MHTTDLDNQIATDCVPVNEKVLRLEIHRLAARAFLYHFISGYGEVENSDEYQILYKGKLRYLALRNARAFLLKLMGLPESNS